MASERLSERRSVGSQRMPADRHIPEPPIVAEAFGAFDTAGVRAALLRESIEPAEPGDDFDILVHPDDSDRVHPALNALGFVRVPAWGHGSHRFFLRFTRDAGWTKLDVVDRLAFGRSQALGTGLEDAVLTRRARRDGAWRLHPADAAWALLLHLALDAPGVRPDERAAELASMADHLAENSPISRFATTLDGGALRDRLISAARTGEFARIRALTGPLSRAWRSRGARRQDAIALRGFAARKAARLLVPMIRPGITVALLGPDGSGKSTAARELRRTAPLDVRPVYMGMYARGTSRVRGLSFLVRVSRLWRGALVARWHAMRGRIVIFDRYSYDALLPSSSGMGRMGRLRRWILARTLPAPDVTLLLDAPPERLRERKAEQSLDDLERQRTGYLAIRKRVPHLVVIDAAMPIQQVSDEIANHVWRRLSARLSGTAR